MSFTARARAGALGACAMCVVLVACGRMLVVVRCGGAKWLLHSAPARTAPRGAFPLSPLFGTLGFAMGPPRVPSASSCVQIATWHTMPCPTAAGHAECTRTDNSQTTTASARALACKRSSSKFSMYGLCACACLQEEQQRVLHVLFERRQPCGADGTIDDPVVGGEGDQHH